MGERPVCKRCEEEVALFGGKGGGIFGRHGILRKVLENWGYFGSGMCGGMCWIGEIEVMTRNLKYMVGMATLSTSGDSGFRYDRTDKSGDICNPNKIYMHNYMYS